MLNRISVCVCLLVLSFGHLFSQVAGLTRSGDNVKQDAVFLDQYGGEVEHPRLSRNGNILHYPPFLVFDSMRVVSPDAAMFYAKVPFDGWSPVLSRGFEYSINENLINPEQLCVQGTLGSFEAEVFGSLPNKTYYVRPFATNAYGTTRGEVSSFCTGPAPVVLDTMFIVSKTSTSIQVRIEVGSNGGIPLSGRMVAFSDDEYQDTAAVNIIRNLGNYSFETISGLTPATDYLLQVVLTNGRYSDTLELHARTLSDLVLTIESNRNPSTPLCQNGNTITYSAVLTGTDVHKPLYYYKWISSTGTESSGGDVFDVYYDAEGTYQIIVDAFCGPDTLSTTFTQVITPQVASSSFYVCTNEFLNTADATTTNIASIRWLNGDNEVVATTRSVKLPTGYYTVECTDNYGCELRKAVYVGKRRFSCVATDTVWANESAHLEEGEWKVDSVADHEGNWYAVTQIGNQCWTRQNIRTRHTPRSNRDLVAPNADFCRMRYMGYINSNNTYDPSTVAYYGAIYTWGAAMDTVSYNSLFIFDRPVRGICPKGWHIPSYGETIEMMEAAYALTGSEEEPYPPFGFGNQFGGQNAPLREVLLEACYDSYTNPAYPEEMYNASGLSLFRTPNTPLVAQFWIANGAVPSAGTNYVFYCHEGQKGATILGGRRQGGFAYARCVRGYAE